MEGIPIAARLTNRDLALRIQRKGLEDLLATSSPFRKFVWTIFTEAGLFAPTYRQGSPHDTSFAEGRRALGLEVLHLLKAVRPDILGLIENEGNLVFQQSADPSPGDPDEPDEDQY